jgi:hypothetical protein
MQEIRKPVSSRKRAANRRNARASTGPRTLEGKRRSRLNALVHGRYARVAPRNLAALGEDPREYQTLLAELMEAHQPANSSERMLVEDIAALRWQRRRAERGQSGKQARAVEELEFRRRRQAIELRRTDAPVPFAALKLGLRTVEDSPGKFRMLLSYLEAILVSAQSRQFSPVVRDMLRTIYGIAPPASGLEIISFWDKLSKSPPSSPEDDRLLSLCGRLEREIAVATEEFEVYKAEQVEVSDARRDAALAPAGPEWKLILRQMNMIDRNLDRKLRLLLEVQRARTRSGSRAGRPPKLNPQNNPLFRGEIAPSD